MNDVMSAELRGKWDALKLSSAGMMSRPDVRAKYMDLDGDFWSIYDLCHDYTMTSVERLYDLYKSVEYIVAANVPGVIIECGVWKGGSMMLVAATLARLGTTRPLFLFDTFEGLPVPDGERDVDLLGNSALDRWRPEWAKGAIEEVAANLESTGYPKKHMHLVRGMVEDTLKQWPAQDIAIARLDTDWYASTAVELRTLWPHLSPGGLLIVDDYGHWRGARQATDEFFGAVRPSKGTRVDYSCRVFQK